MSWTVEPITKKQADFVISRKHYSRHASGFRCAFALVDNEGFVEGVVVFGNPVGKNVKPHAFEGGDTEIYELTRLVIQTTKPNAASYLVGRALQLLPKPAAVMSYADTEWGHSGIVYQATNWTYTGLTGTEGGVVGFIVDGVKIHKRTFYDMPGVKNPVAYARANGIEIVKQTPKHRYFFFVGNSGQKKQMLSRFKYPIVKEYPKSEKRMYDAGEQVLLHTKDIKADGFGGLA
jgi:hypothetical protein